MKSGVSDRLKRRHSGFCLLNTRIKIYKLMKRDEFFAVGEILKLK